MTAIICCRLVKNYTGCRSVPCGEMYDSSQYRPKTLELLQRPAGRRHELRRLRCAVDVSAVSQDYRRADQASLIHTSFVHVLTLYTKHVQ